MSSTRFMMIAGLAALALSTTTHAIPVAPGDFEFLPGTTTGAEPDLGGGVVNDNLIPFSVAPFNVFQTIGGNVQNRVRSSTNLGTLIFSPRIRDTFNIATTSAQITGFQIDGYGGWTTDINYLTDGSGDDGPTSVVRSVNGDLLTFSYADPLHIDGLTPPGLQEESYFPTILTEATTYATTGTMIIFGHLNEDPTQTFSVVIDGLAVPVPLPAPLALVAIGCAVLAMRRSGRPLAD